MSRRKSDRIPFPHPGETLREDFLMPLGMSVNKLALELRVPATRLAEIVHGRRGITADTALRLARYFNTTPKFWLNLQISYEMADLLRSGCGVGDERGGYRTCRPPPRGSVGKPFAGQIAGKESQDPFAFNAPKSLQGLYSPLRLRSAPPTP